MQKSLKSSFNHQRTSSKSKDETKKFVDVGVQTELTLRDTSQFFKESNQQKIAIVLPPNYSVVFLDGSNTASSQKHSIINSVTQEQVRFSINRSDSTTENENQDHEVTSPEDDTCKPQKNALRMVRRSSSFLEHPFSSATTEEGEIKYRSRKPSRHHTIHISSSPVNKENIKLLKRGPRSPKDMLLLNLVNEAMLHPVAQDQEICSVFLPNDEQLLADVLFAMKCQEQNSTVPLEDLEDHLQTAIGISPESYHQILKLNETRKLPFFILRLNKITAKKLKPRYSKGSADTYVALYLTSSPNIVQTTHVVADSLNPEWDTPISFQLSNSIQDENLMVEIWDRVVDESVKDRMTKAIDIKGASTLKKMKNAVQATVGNNTEDRLIGSVTVPLKSCHEKTSWLELQKKDKPKKRGEIQLTYAKCASTKQKQTILAFEKLSSLLITHELKDRHLKDFIFAGDFSENALEILRLYAQNAGITTQDASLCHWSAAAEVHMNHRLSFAWFRELLYEIKPMLTNTNAENIDKFWSPTVKILSSMFCTVRQKRKFQQGTKSDLENLTEALNLMASLADLEPPDGFALFPQELYSFWIKTEVPLNYEQLLENSIGICARNYFEDLTNGLEMNDVDNEGIIQKLILIVQLLQADLQKSEEYYNDLFKKTMNCDYSRTLFMVYDVLLYDLMKIPVLKTCEKIKPIKYENPEPIDRLGELTSLFDLFLNLSQFLKNGQKMWSINEPVFNLKNFQLWFHDCVVHWLHISLSKARAHILKAIQLDKLISIDETVRHSTSAVDTIDIISQQKTLWNQLNWPDPEEAFSFLQRFFEDICDCCDLYAEKLFEKVQTIDQPTDSSISPQWCTAVNNIQFICDHLSTLVSDFGIEKAINQQDSVNHGSETLITIIKNRKERLEAKNLDSFSQIAEELAGVIGGQLLQLAKDTQRDSDSIDILMLFLENSLELLHTGLLEKNFLIVYEICWEKIAKTVEEIVTEGLEELQPCSFFKNISKALNCMLQSFNSENKTKMCLAKILKSTMFLLQKHGSTNSELACAYYKERLVQQNNMTAAPFGILTVACHFKGLDLNITIMNAKNLPPMNPDGKTCDAYVRVVLLPEDLFPDMKKFKTKPKKKTLFPMFDESFVVPLTKEQKMNRDIIILFKVNSREGFAMTAQNHHIGDGLLSIIQVEEWQSDVTIVKQEHLKLSRVGRLDYDCISILERRQSVDKEAKELLKELKQKP